MYGNGSRCSLIKYLIRKIDYFRRQGLRFSRTLEMNITFITSLDLMTYEQYINQPMQMVEIVLNKKFYENPELVKMLKDVHLTLHMGRKQFTLDERRYVITHIYENYQWKMNAIRIISQNPDYFQAHCND